MSNSELIEAARDFNRFYTNFLGVLNRAYLDTPFTLTDARVLFEIGSGGQTSAVTLARDLQLDPAYLSRILKRFRTEGLIETRPDPTDRRSQIALATEKGRAQFQDLCRRSNARINSRFEDLAGGEPQSIVIAMQTIRSLLDPTTPTQPAIIRAHRPGDIGWIVQSQAKAYSEEYGWDMRFEGLIAEVAGRFLTNFDPAMEYCWIAERGGINIGSVFITNGGDDIAKLRLLYLDKSARGLGLGRTLVEECIRFSKARVYRQISLWTNDILSAARTIYIKAGFRLVSEEKHQMFGPELNGQTWVLDL